MWHDPDDRLQKALDRYEDGDVDAARQMLRALDRQGVISPRIDLYLGHCHLDEDRPRAALRRYRRCLSLSPDEAAPWIGVAMCHGRLGRIDRAIEALDQAARLEPEREEVHCHLVHCHALTGRLVEAEAHARIASGLDPDCPHVHRHLAVAYLVAGRPDRSLEAWSEVRARNPAHPEASVGVARCLAALGRRREARRHYLEALRGDYASDAHAGLGDLAWVEGRIDDAAVHYRNSLSREPEHEEARVRLAESLGELGLFDEAWEVLEPLAAAWSPSKDWREGLHAEGGGDPDVALVAARLLRGRGRQARGLRLLRTFVRRSNNAPDAVVALGRYLLEAQRFVLAARVLRGALRRTSGDSTRECARLLARALGRLGRRRHAVQVLARAAWAEPGAVELHLDLAAAQLARGRVHGAERALQRAIARSPRHADLWAASAELALEGGRRDAARRRLAVALRLDPRHGHALSLLVRWLLDRGEAARAVHAARAALRVLPVDHAVVKDFGRALLLDGRHEEAALPLRRYVLEVPADPEGYRLLGQALAAGGDVAAARAQERIGDLVGAVPSLG